MAVTNKLPEKVSPSYKPIQLFIGVSLLLDAVSFLRLLWTHSVFANGRPFGLLYQYAPDWLNYAPQAARFHQPDFFQPPGMIELFTYPAPASIIYFILRCTHSPIAVMKLTIVLTALVLAVLIFRTFHHYCKRCIDQGLLFLVLAVVLSYPLAVEYRQTNIESYLFILLGCGVWLFLRGRDYSAAAVIGAVASIKYYPLTLLGLFLARKKWKPIFVGMGVFIATTVVSLWLATGSIATSWAGTSKGMKFFTDDYMSVYRPDETPYDHSLFALIKTVMGTHFTAASGHNYLHIYMIVAAALGTLLFFTRIRKLPLLNQVCCLVIAICLLPPVSYDYTLMHMYVPLLLILASVLRSPLALRAQSISMALLAVIFSWQVPVIGARFGGGQVKAVALLLFFITVLVWPLSVEGQVSEAGRLGEAHI